METPPYPSAEYGAVRLPTATTRRLGYVAAYGVAHGAVKTSLPAGADRADIRVHDIEAAHGAALKEDKERSETDAQPAEPKQLAQSEEGGVVTADAAEPQRTSGLSALESPKALRQEAAAILKGAGLPEVSPNSEITRDGGGRLLIVQADNATVTTPVPGGKPEIAEYKYDRGTDTLAVKTSSSITTARVVKYDSTDMGQWQTHDDIVTLPDALAKRFGFERAVATG